MDYYKQLVNELLNAGIQPFVTLHHWDLPQAVQNASGGWTNTATIDLFEDYARFVFQQLGDKVSFDRTCVFVYFIMFCSAQVITNNF